MARKKKMALYEVIGKSRGLPDYVKPGSNPDPDPKDKQGHEDEQENKKPEKRNHWQKKTVILQINNGKLDISVPVAYAVAAGLAVVLLLLISFRLGIMYNAPADDFQAAAVVEKASVPVESENQPPVVEEEPQPVAARKPKSTGDNKIVITQYQSRNDLVPVQKHFARAGIDTEILKLGDRYLLVSERMFENPSKPGTLGNEVLNKIKKIGADYKAPPGYEPFGKTPFQDAYGMKFDS